MKRQFGHLSGHEVGNHNWVPTNKRVVETLMLLSPPALSHPCQMPLRAQVSLLVPLSPQAGWYLYILLTILAM